MLIDYLPFWVADYLAAWLFLVLTIALMGGFPVTFTMMGVSFLFGLIGLSPGFFDLLPLRMWGVMTNTMLMAVPLFIFMGLALERSGLARELLETMEKLFQNVRGGLAISVVLVGALLGASTGIVGATVVTMGLMSLPTMLKHKYSRSFASGTVAASGTLGQIIPPSIVLLLLGPVMEVPIGDMFIGAVIPGIILVVLYCLFIWLSSFFGTKHVPAAQEKGAEFDKAFILRIFKALLPPLFLIVAVLGTIFAGIATPTESGAMGAVGAVILTALNRKLSFNLLHEVAKGTIKMTCMVFIIIMGASCFALVFRGLGGDDLLREFIDSMNLSGWQLVTMVMIFIFILGFFLDFIEITYIHIPIIAPIVIDYGYDPLWFGIMFAVNLQTSFMTPPFGPSLFYLKGVCPPEIKTTDVYKGIIPFVFLQLIGLTIIAIWPSLVTWLPKIVYGN
ncbi:MAG: TRAP transporter large permease subunit [Desulfobacula sp.]|jgi:tripartite ATP-independent transporter DctM subunit|uniref:TRAP transporter large permease n=1 Tax=Desulfobacula sp. TaxID=2593537 RepID=UPI001DBF0363|nr:TRAP transporter large permease subunit [Desulfobacula sp.]MBT3484767.1 TRAP transporter large permease subunit [Desulfobacula sp.]MBT3804396.1 TRAP transporter large permease subunit [Desulfobacula sp.]MBT4025187.1 TRAP transporter large permease subunit [Desulfobacula sp.]MBT4198590.1 TRAP transporter large permease subunit [Desulfobacula sp.]